MAERSPGPLNSHPAPSCSAPSERHPGTGELASCSSSRSILHGSIVWPSPSLNTSQHCLALGPPSPRTKLLWMPIKEAPTFLFFQCWLPQDVPHLGALLRFPGASECAAPRCVASQSLILWGWPLIHDGERVSREMSGVYVARYPFFCSCAHKANI